MRTILNLIWFFFGGLWLALSYFFFGVIACVLIITIPAGLAAFRMGVYALWPFGKAVVPKPSAGNGSTLMNVLWFFIAGIWLAIGHLITAAAQGLTIVGIPVAIANLKMIPVCCFPFGKDIVDRRALPPGAAPLHSI